MLGIENMDEFCGSPFWDWNVTWYTDNPDFTPCFERSVLFLLPCAFLWIFALVDAYLSRTSISKEIPWSPLNIAKLVVTTSLVILEGGMIITSTVIIPGSIPSYESYPVDLYVPAIRIKTLLLSVALLLYSRIKGVRSSGVQFLFWLLMLITQTVRFRTVLIANNSEDDGDIIVDTQDPLMFILEVCYFPLVVGQLILHCWADVAPVYKSTSEPVENTSPEYTCSFLSRILFSWFTPLMWSGFRKPLTDSDLWKLSWYDTSRYVVPIFDRYWKHDLNRGSNTNAEDKPTTLVIKNGNSNHEKVEQASSKLLLKEKKTQSESGIILTCFKSFGLTYVCSLFLRLFTDILNFAAPFILRLILDFVSSPDEPMWKGVFFASLLFLVAFFGSTITGNAVFQFYHVGLRMRLALTSAVYRKTLLLSNAAKRLESTGEVVNHMAVDVDYLSDFTAGAYLMFPLPLIISAAMYFLWTILGPSALAGVVIMGLILPLNAVIGSKTQKLQRQQMANKDKRIKLMNQILAGIKVLKLYAWEQSFEDQVMKIRKEEVIQLKKIAYLSSLANFLCTCAPFMVALCSFGAFVLVDSENVLDVQTAFVSLVLFNIMNQSMTFLPTLISYFIQVAVAVKRLNKFLNAEEIEFGAVSRDQSEPNPVVIENGCFSWKSDVETLKNINLTVKDGELVAIVGTVGSGKSSLFSALLSELIKTRGRANIRGKVAYVAQQAWIQNATVRDNILFGRPYDRGMYEKVIKACALKPDLEILPSGDKTEIGEKGINLSGGQKQRIALARAIYSNADVYLLDDPLSAVDAHVGKHIFEKILGSTGMLREKTRLLITHGIVYLPLMDNIVVMTDGCISETGRYSELVAKHGAFADFLAQHVNPDDNPAENQEHVASLNATRRASKSSATSDHENMGESNNSTIRRDSHLSSDSQKKPEKLIEEEKAETENVKSAVYLDYMRAAGWHFCVMIVIFYFAFQGFSVGANLWLSKWTNSASTTNGTNVDSRNFYLGIYGLLGGFQAVMIFVATLTMSLVSLKSVNVLHFKMLQRIMRAPVSFFETTPTGRILNRFAKDIDLLDIAFPLCLRFFLNSAFNVISIIVVVCMTTPIFAAVIIPVGILYYGILRFYVTTSRQLKRLESNSRSPVYSHFGETISGVSTIRAYNQLERFIMESERRTEHHATSRFTLATANRWLQIRLDAVGNTIVFFAALFSVLARDSLSPGLVGLSVSYGLQITSALLFLVRFTSEVEANIVAVERVKEYSDVSQEAPWRVEDKKPSKSWPQNGLIKFDQYQTRYRPGLDLVLRNVTCTINPGEKVGIVGRTGAGKSSMTLAIFRIVEAAGGTIEIDGEDISRLGLHDLRGRITIIPQDPVLFSGSLRINLDPFETQSDSTLFHALELAHLKNFVNTLPGGLDYEIAEGGENLSVGQRQLVCLARALLRKTTILVLDEATAAVDLDTDDLIQQTIRREFKDSTVITIAHRLNTIMDSDRVIILDKGEIREYDSPQNLLADETTIFSSMAKESGTSVQPQT